jgi:hypothetical protein
MDKDSDKFIFESPNGGRTVFKRLPQHTEREIVQDLPDLFTYLEFNEIKRLAETNASVKIALDHLLLIYYTIKDDKDPS